MSTNMYSFKFHFQMKFGMNKHIMFIWVYYSSNLVVFNEAEKSANTKWNHDVEK